MTKEKISRQIFIFFLAQTNPTMEPQKRSKTAKSDFTLFGTRRKHEKIAKKCNDNPCIIMGKMQNLIIPYNGRLCSITVII